MAARFITAPLYSNRPAWPSGKVRRIIDGRPVVQAQGDQAGGQKHREGAVETRRESRVFGQFGVEPAAWNVEHEGRLSGACASD
jgi:hypothetical protein